MQKPGFYRDDADRDRGVRDLDAAIRRYENDYGIGPWGVHTFKPGYLTTFAYGKPIQHSMRIATAMIGHVQWELIEPLEEERIFARFLAEKGEGVHHIAVLAPNFDETVAMQAKRGNELALSCTFSGIACAPRHRPGSRALIEIFSGLPNADKA